MKEEILSPILIIIGAACTLGIYSILYKENKVYRFFEHLFIGLATGYTIYIAWNDVLKPKWWVPMTEGGKWWWAFALTVSLLFYTIYTKRHAWMSRLVFGLFFGFAAGQVFQGFTGEYWPLIRTAINRSPIMSASAQEALVKSGKYYWMSPISFGINNILYVVIIVCVMMYFFFSFEQKNKIVSGTSRWGRYLLMFAFGSIFGNTIMARMSLLIGRMYFLIHDFLQVTVFQRGA